MIDDVPRIAAGRLELVPLTVADAARVFEDAKDPALYRYLQQRPPAALRDLEALYERWSGGSPDPRYVWLNWVAVERESGERVGTLQATIDRERRSATIAYTVFARFHGRRFAAEAATALLASLKKRGDVDRAAAEISEPNARSRRVVESLGFRLTGRIAGEGREDGRICDDVVYTRDL